MRLKKYFKLYLSLAFCLIQLFSLLVSKSTFGQGGPVLDVVPKPILCPKNSCQQIAQSVTITAAPGTIIDGASIYIYSGFTSGQDSLSFTPMFGVTGTFNSNTGVLTLNGTATAAQYEQILLSVCYSDLSATITQGYHTIFYVLGALLYNPVNTHYYKLISSVNPVSWTSSKNAAAASNYLGMQGYLVTITDAQENGFLTQLVNANTWIGASDAAVSGEWRWKTGCEGAEDGGLGRHFSDQINFSCLSGTGTGISYGGNYVNWYTDEPNDCNGNESYAHFLYWGYWNDLPDNGNNSVFNYIVEYGCTPGDPVVQTFDSISVYINDSIETPVLSNNMPVCDGDTINLFSAGTYTPLVAYQWSGPNGYSSTLQNPNIPNVSQSVNGNYVLSVLDSGCTATNVININQPPPISAILDSVTNVFCNGGNNGIIYQQGTSGTPGYNYLWNNGQVSANCSGLVAGTYTVTITDVNGCTGTSTFNVTQPTALNANISSTVNVSCQGNDGKATVSASGGVSGYSYLWSNGNTTSSATGFAVGIFTVTVTDAKGCTITATGSLTSIPTLTAVTISNPTICIGQATNITIAANSGTAPYSYQWSNGSIATSVSVSPALTTNYTATVTDANNCTASAVYIVTVNPPLSIANISNDTTVCKAQPVTVSANAAGGNGTYSYLWNNGNTNATFTVNPLTTTTLYVSIHDNCGTPLATDSVKITVIDYPTVDFSYLPNKGCMPLDVQFNDLSIATPGSSYSWHFGDNGTSSQQSPLYTYIQSGLYTVSLTITTPQGCKSGDTIKNAIDVYPRPVADFSYSPSHPTILLNNVEFLNYTSGLATQFLWDFGDSSASSSLQNPMHVYNDTGKYMVTLIVNNDFLCSDTIFKILEIDDEFSFFMPNAFTPNDDNKNDELTFYGFNYSSFDMKIYNRWGQLIRETNVNPVWNGKDKNGDLLPEGVYAYYIVLLENYTGKKHTYRGTITLVR